MQISKKSWHYRLIDKFDFYHSRNLCSYFWLTMWCLFVCVLIACGGTTIAIVASMPFWWWTDPTFPLGVAIFIGLVDVCAMACLLGGIVEARHKREIETGVRTRPERKPYVYKEPGLFQLWLKAKHDKICPLIKFE